MAGARDVVIIGAGPAGIAVGLSLGACAVVLERRQHVGGLSGSIELDGAVFDVGGHSFHTPHPEVRALVFDAVEMYEQKRQARCFTHGALIEYPFQRHFRAIPDASVVEACASGLASAHGASEATHFEDYIRSRFGPGIAEHFMLPYNRKLWGRDLSRLGVDWVGERVAAPEGRSEKFEVSGGKRKPLHDDTLVAYPARGGFGEIYEMLGRGLHDVRLGSDVAHVDLARRSVSTRDGASFEWTRLVSSMPINELIARMPEAPAWLRDEVGALEALRMKVVLVVVGRPLDTEVQRIYVADPAVASHKIALNHNSSDTLRGRPRHGVMAEISYSDDKPLARADVETWVVEDLCRLGVLRAAEDVVRTSVIDIQYAYPVPTRNRQAIVDRAMTWLAERGVHSVGRFGEWAYVNSDECLHRGLALGQRLRAELEFSA